MPFDHARCPSCNGIIDPEKLVAGEKGPLCPYCNATLSLVDLFGVAAQFAEGDDDGNNLTLDDLVGTPGSPPRRDRDDDDLSLDHLLPGPTNRRK
jgi:hypothetical protein